MAANVATGRPGQQIADGVKSPDSIEALRESIERHDAKQIAAALHVPANTVYDWLAGERRNPIETAALLIEHVSHPEVLIHYITRRLGYMAIRAAAGDDTDLAKLTREFADVLDARAKAESDGRATPGERRELAREAFELAEAATAYGRAQMDRALADERLRRIS